MSKDDLHNARADKSGTSKYYCERVSKEWIDKSGKSCTDEA